MFWRPVGDRLFPDRAKHFFAWPGLGNEPHDPAVQGLDDLVARVVAKLDEPADLIAQSVGGLIAMKAALTVPDKMRRIVLTATSAGVPVRDLGGEDWRPEYRREFPAAAPWVYTIQEDLSARLPSVTASCLLLWGDADSISPPAVGQRLLELLPNARLNIVHGGGHDLAITHAAEAAALIAGHLL